MMSNYLIGDSDVLKYLIKITKKTYLQCSFNGFNIPINELENASQIVVQAELGYPSLVFQNIHIDKSDVFYNIKTIIPRLLLFDYIPIPIVVVGFLSEKYYIKKYKIPLNSKLFQYVRLPLINTNKLLAINSTSITSLEKTKKNCNKYFTEVALSSSLYHDFKSKTKQFNYDNIIVYKEKINTL